MLNISQNLKSIQEETSGYSHTLIAVSKTKPIELIDDAYQSGQRDFGENKVQELVSKNDQLPKDIRWHMIGHLQRNKVKQIVPFVHLIHSVDSERLLLEINKEGKKIDRKINCLLQVHIASESSKFGFDKKELIDLVSHSQFKELQHVQIIGLMGMATFTEDEAQIKREFSGLKLLFDEVKENYVLPNLEMKELSMGMSGDYRLALECGSTMIRVGSLIFGERTYD